MARKAQFLMNLSRTPKSQQSVIPSEKKEKQQKVKMLIIKLTRTQLLQQQNKKKGEKIKRKALH